MPSPTAAPTSPQLPRATWSSTPTRGTSRADLRRERQPRTYPARPWQPRPDSRCTRTQAVLPLRSPLSVLRRKEVRRFAVRASVIRPADVTPRPFPFRGVAGSTVWQTLEGPRSCSRNLRGARRVLRDETCSGDLLSVSGRTCLEHPAARGGKRRSRGWSEAGHAGLAWRPLLPLPRGGLGLARHYASPELVTWAVEGMAAEDTRCRMDEGSCGHFSRSYPPACDRSHDAPRR